MDELRVRLERLIRIENDPIRLSEHKTFNRLLYRNRNQHRHGLYFRRLEHVRRLLKCADKHIVWESVRHAVGDNFDKNSRSKTKPPLSISSVTLDDLHAIESSHHALVTAAIPKAAVKVTLELVSRSHFLPFAVAIIATLSRLFVVEQKLLSELRGAVVETKLLLNTAESTIGQGLHCRRKDDVSEDVGEVVRTPPESGLETQHANMTRPADVLHPKPNSANSLTASDAARQSASLITYEAKLETAQKPSLYDLMAEHDAGAATIAASKIRCTATVSTIVDRELRPDLTKKPEESPVLPRKRNHDAVFSEDVLPTSSPRPGGRERASEIDKRVKYLKNTSDNGEVGAVSEGDSDSDDDLDDIFDAMGD